jgi:organic radical activating enzyme
MDLTPYKNCLALTNSIFVANEEKPYRPCCWFKTYIDATDITDYNNQLAEMDLEYNCDYCIQQDKGGEYSYRQKFIHTDELTITASFDNICNLKCVTCTPHNSTQILAEKIKHETTYTSKYFAEVVTKQAPKKIDFIKTMLNSASFNDLRFDILGGEPLINPAIFEFIDWLAEQPYAKKTSLTITTNGTTYTDKIVKYIDSFKTVGVQLSIDGIGDEFEYLRFGSSFEQLEKVCDSFYALTEKYENFRMGCHYTLSWMNCLQFDEFFNWMQTKYPNIANVYVSKLQTPNQYSIELLSLVMRTKVYNEVTTHLQNPVNESYEKALFLYKEHMLTTAYDNFNLELFKHGIDTLCVSDGIRGNDHRKIIKKFVNFLSLYLIHPHLKYINKR